MANNLLRPETDLATREFFRVITQDESFLEKSPATRRAMIAGLLEALNYAWLPNGAFIERGQNMKMKFGQADYSGYPDEWDADEERVRETIDNQATPETSTSVASESTSVRETILSEDV